jgi:16S rRNA G527 N7-methylase RsmG
MNFKEKIKLLFSKEIFKKLCKYVDLIEKENKMINLTNFLDDKL